MGYAQQALSWIVETGVYRNFECGAAKSIFSVGTWSLSPASVDKVQILPGNHWCQKTANLHGCCRKTGGWVCTCCWKTWRLRMGSFECFHHLHASVSDLYSEGLDHNCRNVFWVLCSGRETASPCIFTGFGARSRVIWIEFDFYQCSEFICS